MCDVHLLNVPHINGSNNRPLNMPNENSTRVLDDSGSHFFYLASARLAPIVALASTSFANPAFSYLAVVLVSPQPKSFCSQ
jgi:hypothetical protein